MKIELMFFSIAGTDRNNSSAIAEFDLPVESCDGGSPIPDDARTRIFDAYERAHEPGSETASVEIGLSVARKLARLMGGDLTYRHAGDSIFELTMPSTDPEVTEARSVPSHVRSV